MGGWGRWDMMHKVIFQLKYERGNGEVEEEKIAGGGMTQ